VASDEQLSICIRYVEEGVPQEMFVAFHECVSGVTGEAISENIISNLTVWQLQPHLLRGEAYDGAGGMSGLLKDLLGDWHDAWLSMLPIQEHGFIREHLEMLFVCAMVGSLTCFL
jgi:hypothetical protein